MTPATELRITRFLSDLNNPDMYGFAVTQEVREIAKDLHRQLTTQQHPDATTAAPTRKEAP